LGHELLCKGCLFQKAALLRLGIAYQPSAFFGGLVAQGAGRSMLGRLPVGELFCRAVARACVAGDFGGQEQVLALGVGDHFGEHGLGRRQSLDCWFNAKKLFC
jgi:hypothetical protein